MLWGIAYSFVEMLFYSNMPYFIFYTGKADSKSGLWSVYAEESKTYMNIFSSYL